jgi:hypothetical protein
MDSLAQRAAGRKWALFFGTFHIPPAKGASKKEQPS